ncbi:NXPE family member 3-like isoform X2 [Trematomus bernacchii]|nr:NXPE family member 3-like isoform X2 [Trematomus bernacchii]XP_033987286.1 NXPE family member 3-like isoform X2 [Trematomus bernacchii]
MKESSFKGRTCLTIFLLLLTAFLIFLQLNIWDTLFQPKMSSPIIYPKATTKPPKVRSICNFPPLSPKDALEERLILESVAWPETPALPSPLSLELTSHPAHSSFTILPARGGGGQWHVGDQLEVSIAISDFKGQPKKSGEDFLVARLHNLTLGAGVAGKVVDHLNGSYSVVFPLLWEGAAQVEVTLVHPSEAITVLNRLNREHPDRVFFISVLSLGSQSQTTICNICLRQTKQPICDFTDPRTGDPYFCYNPKNMSCDARIARSSAVQTPALLKAKEDKLFQGGVNLKVRIPASGPAGVTVLPKKEGQPEVESSIVNFQASGYYYQGLWRALDGTKVRQFTGASAITQCLKGKVVHMYGDSTIRQWFEFLNAALPDLKEFNLGSSRQNGPFMALDYKNTIMVTFHLHGPPLRFIGSMEEIRYIANELDDLIGVPNTVVVFGIWAHFGSFPIEVYIRRLQRIRSAVVRLLDRAPKTVIIIRTGNAKTVKLLTATTNGDWFSMQNDKVLRAIFKGLNVHLIDAWEMVLAHHLPNNLHPQPPIIKNIMNVLFSYTCPQKGG